MLKPYSSLASFNFAIHKEVKLSVTGIFISLNSFLFMKNFFLVLYLVNLIIIARPFLRPLFLLPIRCVRSMSDGFISSPSCSLMMLTEKVSVSSFPFSSTPCIRKQYRLEYCSCLSTFTEKLFTLSVNSVTCAWSFIISSFLVSSPFHIHQSYHISAEQNRLNLRAASPL